MHVIARRRHVNSAGKGMSDTTNGIGGQYSTLVDK